jgi:hypothetical protein
MKKRLELKKRIAWTRWRNKYYRGEFVWLLSPDNTPYRYWDLKRESIVEIFDEIIANMG